MRGNGAFLLESAAAPRGSGGIRTQTRESGKTGRVGTITPKHENCRKKSKEVTFWGEKLRRFWGYFKKNREFSETVE